MENIPDNERKVALTTFGRVGVVQPNKIKKQMATCNNCTIVLPVAEYGMWKHWKFDCAHKWSFKYVYPTDVGEKTKIACLVCQKKFDNVTLNFMKAHRVHCKQRIQLASVNSLQATDLSSQVVLNDQRPANNYSVNTTVPIDLDQMQFNKFQFTLGGNRFHYGTQCRLCKEVFLCDTLKLLQHRTQCQIGNSLSSSSESNEEHAESDVLITVQTVHIPTKNTQNASQSILTTNTSDNSPPPSTAAANSEFCFVCNASSNGSCVKMFGTVSTGSKKPMYDFIWKFLGSKPSVRNANADASSLNDEVICEVCFKMICDYDEARSSARRLKKQIRQKLTITERYFEQMQNRTDATQTAMECDDGDCQEQQTDAMIMEDDVCDVIDLCDDDD